MNGFVQRFPQITLTDAPLGYTAFPSVFQNLDDISDLKCAYNMLNHKNSVSELYPLQLGKLASDAVFDPTNKYLNIATTAGFAGTGLKATDLASSSFCAVVTVRCSNLVAASNATSARKSVFGDYDENSSGLTTGFRLALSTDKLTFFYKSLAGTASSVFDVALASSPLNKWITLIVDVNRGAEIKIKSSSGASTSTTDSNIVNYIQGTKDLQFGGMDETANIADMGMIGNILGGAIFEGSQSNDFHSTLFSLASDELIKFERGYTYA